MNVSNLPVSEITDKVNEALKHNPGLVITAPPGAGKSTLLPLTILEGLEGGGKILMLEPRRLAAIQIASRMARILGEECGQTVGYRVRFDTRVGPLTRIEVVTEGILTRMIISDPTLEGVDAIIFDEFHERSLICDEAAALALHTRNLLRDDLKLIVMSATIDPEPICRWLGVPHISSRGRMFPVETVLSDIHADASNCAEAAVKAVRRAHESDSGDILVFLPGEAEIRKAAEALENTLGDTAVLPLYGMLDRKLQQKALSPSPEGGRKVVLSTPVAETSLTIEGVRVVIDTGLCRKMVFNPQTALGRLETVRISRDMADQRAGRAGRLGPGKCYRLWSLADDTRMNPTRVPEILEADLAPLVLDIAAWGADPDELPWLTPPPKANLVGAQRLLRDLGALKTGSTMITGRGTALSGIPAHPRIANMILKSRSVALETTGADLAALIEDRDPLGSDPSAGADLCLRVRKFHSPQYRTLIHARTDRSPASDFEIGSLLAAAYPERIAKASQDGPGHFILASGQKASVDSGDPIAAYDWICVAALGVRNTGEGRIFLAAPLDPMDISELHQTRDILAWDSRKGGVVARSERRIGCLPVDSRALDNPDPDEITAVICQAAPKEGLSMFDFSDEVAAMQQRIAAVSSWHPEMNLPDVSTSALLEKAAEWIPYHIGSARTIAELKKIDLRTVIWSMLDYNTQTEVDRLAPTHIHLPNSKRAKVEYRQGAHAPIVRVRLQEVFGMSETPRVDGGSRAVLMELLSPGFKPVQLTSDLKSFWSGTYFEVRKELRRRYPKHAWPEDPGKAI